MPGESSKPLGLRRCVADVVAKGGDIQKAFAVCTASLQKAGVLKKGTQELTKKGQKRTKSQYSKAPDLKSKDAEYEKLFSVEDVQIRLGFISDLLSELKEKNNPSEKNVLDIAKYVNDIVSSEIVKNIVDNPDQTVNKAGSAENDLLHSKKNDLRYEIGKFQDLDRNEFKGISYKDFVDMYVENLKNIGRLNAINAISSFDGKKKYPEAKDVNLVKRFFLLASKAKSNSKKFDNPLDLIVFVNRL